jgi:hypothetical protein
VRQLGNIVDLAGRPGEHRTHGSILGSPPDEQLARGRAVDQGQREPAFPKRLEDPPREVDRDQHQDDDDQNRYD